MCMQNDDLVVGYDSVWIKRGSRLNFLSEPSRYCITSTEAFVRLYDDDDDDDIIKVNKCNQSKGKKNGDT